MKKDVTNVTDVTEGNGGLEYLRNTLAY